MIASEAIVPKESSSQAYSSLFSHTNYQLQRAELPSIGTFLSQGVAGGAVLGFLFLVLSMLRNPENGYNFLLIAYLPVLLGTGGLFGLEEAAVFWAGSYILDHRINSIVRAVLGPVILIILVSIFSYLFFEQPHYSKESSITDLWFGIGLYIGGGVVLGLLIGSRIRPVVELIRGSTAEQWPVLNALTGLALRLIVIFGLMVSTLLLIVETQGAPRKSELMMSVIAVVHFALALLIVFARMPFWLLLPLAVIINVPIAAWTTDVLTPNEFGVRVISIIYLTLWGGFLLCRAIVPSGAVAFIKRELRYYFTE